MTQAVDVTVVNSLDEMEALRPEWMALWRRCPAATPFQSPAWLIAWWRHFGRGEALLLVLRRDARLVGLAPLFLCEDGDVRTVLPIGVGITDYLGALFDRDLGDRGAALVFRHLAAQPHRWAVCDLQQLPQNSPLLDAPAPRGWSDRCAVQDACPVLELPDSVEALRRVLPRSTVRHLRANRRRAEAVGEVRVGTADRDNLEEYLAVLFRLHGACWNARGQPGVLADAAIRAFHREVAAAFVSEGLLRLNVLWLRGRAAAAYYGFLAKRCAYAYIGGFDPAWAPFGLGSELIGWSIEQAVREGATEFHFLRGREAYKYKWGAKDRLNHRRTLARTASVGVAGP